MVMMMINISLTPTKYQKLIYAFFVFVFFSLYSNLWDMGTSYLTSEEIEAQWIY